MITMLKNWKGSAEVDGTRYDSMEAVTNAQIAFNDTWHIKLFPDAVQHVTKRDNVSDNSISESEDIIEHKITVKAYMTKPTEPGSSFDFMQKWNNNKPMPLRTMVGTIEKETRGMVYMKLHGQGQEEICCMRCGRRLTHPISRHYGIGPECMSKIGIIADIEDVDSIKEKLVDITWEGWVVKSSIIKNEEV